MGREQRLALTSSYRLLISHLLKWQFQPEPSRGHGPSPSRGSAPTSRSVRQAAISGLGRQNGKSIVDDAYGKAVREAMKGDRSAPRRISRRLSVQPRVPARSRCDAGLTGRAVSEKPAHAHHVRHVQGECAPGARRSAAAARPRQCAQSLRRQARRRRGGAAGVRGAARAGEGDQGPHARPPRSLS